MRNSTESHAIVWHSDSSTTWFRRRFVIIVTSGYKWEFYFLDKDYLSQWPGGETQALERMQAKFNEQNLFKRRNNNRSQPTGLSILYEISEVMRNSSLKLETSTQYRFGARDDGPLGLFEFWRPVSSDSVAQCSFA